MIRQNKVQLAVLAALLIAWVVVPSEWGAPDPMALEREASADAATEHASTSGPQDPDRPDAGGGAEPPPATFVSWPSEPGPPAKAGGVAEKVLSQGALPRGARCGGCGRTLRRDSAA